MQKTTRTLSLVLTMLSLLSFQLKAQQDNYFEVSKNLDIFSNLYKQIDINYVDDIQPGAFMKTGIDAMLRTLDPYTVYITEGAIEDARFMMTGEYGGIGANFHMHKGTPIIAEPFPASPAVKAGLMAGDRILSVNGRPTKGRSLDDISQALHGEPGTVVKLEIERPGKTGTFTQDVTREKVKVENIPYHGIISPGIGYIKLDGFTQEAGQEVLRAFESMRNGGKLSGLILDLRGNGGGLLLEAVKICNIFVPKNKLIVSTKGKLPSSNIGFKTTGNPIDLDIPVIVLVDSRSASASEIVGGALQDLDRAVIIGQRSFGKGLVQNIFPLSYNAQVKITTAKYYIPSGRCIQAIDYSHRDEDGAITKIPDSLVSAFKTAGGRAVYDGGGITPDLTSELYTPSILARALVRDHMIFDYATFYKQKHATIDTATRFQVTAAIFNDFKDFLKEKNYAFSTETEESMTTLKKALEQEGYAGDVATELKALQQKIEARKMEDLDAYRDEISRMLRLEIISRYYYQRGKVESALSDDPDVVLAIQVLNEPERYRQILSGVNQGK
ncbi:MAG TPA: S41 family peptidase [Bacteroidales bacterium]|nr:PDZ domain-containing protein [Lentimicrobiaceae bacterium]HOH99500.1 S41 family peptidase [Bacteroidales bacterium]